MRERERERKKKNKKTNQKQRDKERERERKQKQREREREREGLEEEEGVVAEGLRFWIAVGWAFKPDTAAQVFGKYVEHVYVTGVCVCVCVCLNPKP